MLSIPSARAGLRACALLVGGSLAGLAALAPDAAKAHPHVLIEAALTVLGDNGAFTGVQHRWTFDEFYTSTAIEGLDANNDGVYDREELAELAKVNIEGLKEFNYFVAGKLGDRELKFGDVKEYWLEHKNGLLTLVFTLAFDKPIPSNAPDLQAPNEFRLAVGDPTFFIAFEWAKSNAAMLGQGTSASCKIGIGSPSNEPAGAPDKSDEETLRGAFAQQFGGAVGSSDRSVHLTCNPKSSR